MEMDSSNRMCISFLGSGTVLGGVNCDETGIAVCEGFQVIIFGSKHITKLLFRR